MVAFRKEPPGFASAHRKTSQNCAAVSTWLSIIVRTIRPFEQTAHSRTDEFRTWVPHPFILSLEGLALSREVSVLRVRFFEYQF
jgi:hypothetical protein